MTLPKWSTFIAFHPDSVKLQIESELIINIFNNANSPTDRLANITSLKTTPSTVILTLDSFDNSITSSFYHQTLGLMFRSQSQSTCNALTGFGSTAIPIQLNTDQIQSLIPSSANIDTPSLTTLMNTHNQDITNLRSVGVEALSHRPIRKSAPLPPILIQALLQHVNPQPWETLHIFIKAIATLKPEESEEGDWSTATKYFAILTTIWAFCNHTEIPNLHTSRAPSTDPAAIAWCQNLHKQHITGNMVTNPPPNTNEAITRLTQTLAAREDRFASIQEEGDDKKDDDITRRWKKLDRTMQQATLIASTTDGLSTPTLPSERLLQLIQAKNGATASRLFHRWHPKLDILVQAGMASNIATCTFASQPDEFAIDTFSPFFTPPTRAGFQNITNDELNGLAMSCTSFNLSASDIKKLTYSKPYVATSPVLLKQQIKNFHAVLGDVFGEDALLTQIVQKLINHYEENEMLYHTIINEEKYFIVWLLNRVHFKTQSILHQCLTASDVEDVHFAMYSLDNEIKQISTFSFQAVAPRWYTDELNKQAERPTGPPGRGKQSYSDYRKSRTDTPYAEREKRTRVENNKIDSFVSLQSNERYPWVTHIDNLRKCVDKAQRLGGEFLCNNWHIRGHCYTECSRKITHVELSTDMKAGYRTYVQALRKSQKEFANSRRSNYAPERTPNDTNREGEGN